MNDRCLAATTRDAHHLRATHDRTVCGRPTVPHGAGDDVSLEESAAIEARIVATLPLCGRCAAG